MHALTLLVTGALIFALAYRFYAKFIITNQGNFNAILSVVMLVLVVVIFFEALKKMNSFRKICYCS